MNAALRLAAAWRARDARGRDRLAVAALAAAAVLLQAPLWGWMVDDAAISFAFAQNLADGEGLVATPGGERVEGYSNPLWMLLLAGFEWVGLGAPVGARLLGVAFTAATFPLVFAVARLAGTGPATPFLAGLFLAANAQFAIWNASGLENPLFHLLLAAGLWRLLEESRRDGAPGSALLFLGVALTRPEGVLYAAVAGVAVALFAWRDRRGPGPALLWLALFALPFAAYHAARFAYFAWELPNTYYAKMGHDGASLLDWNAPGWQYVRAWAGVGMGPRGPGLWQALWLPVYALGAWPALGALGARGHDGPRARALLLCSALTGVAVAFPGVVQGDWMNGYRWLSFAAVPGSVLLASGVTGLLERLPAARGRREIAGAILVVLFAAPHLHHLSWFTWNRAATLARLLQRADYWEEVRERLGLERPTLLDVDMGALLYTSRARVVDLQGLTDVPFAHQHWDERFVREYVFEEIRPDFAHVHGAWAARSGIPAQPEWDAEYLEIPGYLRRDTRVHGGSRIRRDLLVAKSFARNPDGATRFRNGASLAWRLVGLPSAPGRAVTLWVEFAWKPGEARGEETPTLHVFVAGEGKILSRERLTPGYGWLTPATWPQRGVVRSRLVFRLPNTAAPGRYDLGFILVDEGGRFVRARRGGPGRGVVGGVAGAPSLLADGEVRFPGAVHVVGREAQDATTQRDLEAANERAGAGDCRGAEQIFAGVRDRLGGRGIWQRDTRHVAGRVASTCWARATAKFEGQQRIALLERARLADRRAPELLRAAGPVADASHAAGIAARDRARALRAARSTTDAPGSEEREAWEAAYRAFIDVLRVDPTRAWARRHAEEARRERLGLGNGDPRPTRLAPEPRSGRP